MKYQCSICGRSVEGEGPLPPLYPFCSERCRMVDLGRWFGESYTVEREIIDDDGGPDPRPSEPRP